ncbi:Transposable element Tcb1 transposase [Chionoecetes opilio]|uniref:Transposable element Tcb1 transposase n=1 Tax=Chionoecetes opilio TaxID=41210 RepID=A0A8J5D4R7_CHIOP|nr:Transposable element Tcb1 transposase [Chionoecetes opilio]
MFYIRAALWSLAVKNFLKEHKINVLEWPGNSPDLNLIENAWSHMKKKVQASRPSNIKDLQEALKNFENLARSMPTRLEKLADENVETVVTIVMLSLLFVVVLTGLTMALIRPWTKRSGLKPKRSKRAEGHVVASDKARNFPDARFMQHIHMDPYRHHDSNI